jgi:hypothetical protein
MAEGHVRAVTDGRKEKAQKVRKDNKKRKKNDTKRENVEAKNEKKPNTAK